MHNGVLVKSPAAKNSRSNVEFSGGENKMDSEEMKSFSLEVAEESISPAPGMMSV